jgi:alpha-tubulin suppressor-like RCC1 family protein
VRDGGGISRGRTLRAALLSVGALSLLLAATAQGALSNTALPSVSGTRGTGETLTATSGTWSGTEPISYAYEWERCTGAGSCTLIPGATAESYVQVSGDQGKLVLVTVTASNAEGSASATSPGLSAISWGQNDHGQLGAIYKDPYEEAPVDVEGLTTIKSISAAESFNLALLSNGTVASFGGDSKGQLGDEGFKSTWERGLSHSMVKGLTGVTAVAAANEHALALTSNGKVWAWGANNDGLLAKGVGGFEGESGVNSRVPNEIPGLKETVKAIAVGGASDFALLEGGEVEAWGQNTNGELGVAWKSECQKTNSTSPACKEVICKTGGGNQLCETTVQPVVDSENHPIKHVVAIAAGTEQAYALLENGRVLAWGSNRFGALGRTSGGVGAGAKFIPPGEVVNAFTSEPLTNVVEISAGAHDALAIREGGETVGWGDLEEGALGEMPGLHWTCASKAPCQPGAFAIKGLESVHADAVSAGANYGLVLSGSHVYAFGRDERGELANGTTSEAGTATPTISTKLNGAAEISAGPTHGLALVPEAPSPLIVVHRETNKIRFSWTNTELFAANHLNYHEFERPGLTEPEESAGEECEAQLEGEGLYPKTCPLIKHEPVSSGNLTTLEQTLIARPGNWHGAEPVAFKYQWQRCPEPIEAACVNIAEATGETYKPVEADLGDYIRVLVTAEDTEGGAAQSVSVPTQLTSRVQKAKTKETVVYSVNIKKEEEKGEITGHELTVPQVGHSGEPATLSKVPWEFKVSFGAKARWFIATPE